MGGRRIKMEREIIVLTEDGGVEIDGGFEGTWEGFLNSLPKGAMLLAPAPTTPQTKGEVYKSFERAILSCPLSHKALCRKAGDAFEEIVTAPLRGKGAKKLPKWEIKKLESRAVKGAARIRRGQQSCPIPPQEFRRLYVSGFLKRLEDLSANPNDLASMEVAAWAFARQAQGQDDPSLWDHLVEEGLDPPEDTPQEEAWKITLGPSRGGKYVRVEDGRGNKGVIEYIRGLPRIITGEEFFGSHGGFPQLGDRLLKAWTMGEARVVGDEEEVLRLFLRPQRPAPTFDFTT